MNKNMFEYATRYKLRFPFKGVISVEDLWDLSVENLDSIFKTLNSQMRTSNEESLLSEKSAENETLELQIEIVKYIVNVKLNEQANRKAEKEKAEQKQKILGIIAEKENAELYDKSKDELYKMLENL